MENSNWNDDYLVVMIHYKTQAGQEDQALIALLDLIEKVKHEPNYVSITVHHNASDPSDILLYEQWSDENYYRGDHMKTPHLKQFIEDSVTYFAGPPEISFWKIKSKIVFSEI